MEKYDKLNEALQEWGVTDAPLAPAQAAEKLAAYLSVKVPENAFCCSFGQYAICTKEYALLTAEELEQCRKLLKSRKCKLWVRLLADVRYYGKEYAGVAAPGRVLWELSKVTPEEAQAMAAELSAILGIALDICS